MKLPFALETAFERYQLDEVLGEGGAGRVYGGIDGEEKPVAIKILASDRATKDKMRRFRNEIAFLTRNQHPNIVSVLDHGLAQNGSEQTPFYVMPRYQTNLRELIKDGMTPDRALELFAGILHGVEAVHFKNAVHRDLKPENILIDCEMGSPAVADFGVARFTADLLVTQVETGPSQRLANFMYAAPEQRAPGSEVGLTADIYALGLMLNELFTGVVPHGTDYDRIGTVHSDLSYLDDVVTRLIQQNPERRLQSISDIKGSIAKYRSEFLAHQKLSQINNTVIPEGEIDEPLAHYPPNLIDADWQNGCAMLKLDRPVNSAWISALINLGSITYLPHAHPTNFSFSGTEARVNARPDDLQQIVDFFKSWLPKASAALKHNIIEENNRRRLEELEQLRRQRIAEEQRINVLQKLKI